MDGGENVGVYGGGLDGAELGDGECQRGQELLMGIDDVLRDFFIEQRSIGGQGALMFVLVTVGRNKIGAVGGAIDGDFALRAAADGADFFALGGTEAGGFALVADRAGHGISPGRQDN